MSDRIASAPHLPGLFQDLDTWLEMQASWWCFPQEVMSCGLTDVNLTYLSSFIILNNSVRGTRIHPFHCQMTSSVLTVLGPDFCLRIDQEFQGFQKWQPNLFMLTWVQVHLKKNSKLNRVLNILFPFAKEFEVILKYVEGCLVTTVS